MQLRRGTARCENVAHAKSKQKGREQKGSCRSMEAPLSKPAWPPLAVLRPALCLPSLMWQAHRDSLAEAVNSAVLRHHGLPSRSPLEALMRQACLALRMLQDLHVPHALLVDGRQVLFGPSSTPPRPHAAAAAVASQKPPKPPVPGEWWVESSNAGDTAQHSAAQQRTNETTLSAMALMKPPSVQWL